MALVAHAVILAANPVDWDGSSAARGKVSLWASI
jgi:hypothetical protein